MLIIESEKKKKLNIASRQTDEKGIEMQKWSKHASTTVVQRKQQEHVQTGFYLRHFKK
jgi:hypothetical protein